MKFTGYMSPAFVMLKEMYPDAKYIFMTRRFKPTMASHRSVIEAQSALARLLGELHEVRSRIEMEIGFSDINLCSVSLSSLITWLRPRMTNPNGSNG